MAIVEAYTAHINQSVTRALSNSSKLSADMLAIEGMSGTMTRHLYNNMCSLAKPDGSLTRYLEVGAWKGSSTVAALFGNPVLATVIDNWSEFGGPKDAFWANLGKHLGYKPEAPCEHLEVVCEDCFALSSQPRHAPYDVYLYDGHHTIDSHEQAITKVWPLLADPCILMVDDWTAPQVRQGTLRGLARVKARVAYQVNLGAPHGRHGFWCGCGIFLLCKE